MGKRILAVAGSLVALCLLTTLVLASLLVGASGPTVGTEKSVIVEESLLPLPTLPTLKPIAGDMVRTGPPLMLRPTLLATTVRIDSADVREGRTGVVSIMIKTFSNLGYAGVNLTFNESVINVTAISDSDFDSTPNIHTRGLGWVLLEGGQSDKGLKGTVRLCNVTLHAIGKAGDISMLNLTDVALDDMQMKPITVQKINHGYASIIPGYTFHGYPAGYPILMPTPTPMPTRTTFFTRKTTSFTRVRIGNATAGEGETAIVSILIENVSNLGYAGVNLTFDESVVNVTAISGSNFDFSPHNRTRGSGWALLEGGQSESGLKGKVRLCNVTLRAIGEAGDISMLNLTDVALDNMQMEPITLDYITNGSFTINNSAYCR